jgi:hypothetical protein
MTSSSPAQFTPKHPIIRDYQRELAELRATGLSNELALRRPFANLLAGSARLLGWQLAEEIAVAGQKIRPDGTVRDANSLPRGYWEAKDTADDLAREIDRKIRRGYPLTNTIFL